MDKDKQIQTLSTIVNRMALASKLGEQYGGDRDIYEALGYKTTLFYKDYLVRYLRQDMAKAIIDRPVNATWQGNISIIESDDKDETPLEIAFNTLQKDLKLKSKFIRADKLAGIGEYAVIFLGFNDVSKKEEFINPVEPHTNLKLMYVKPLGQGSAAIDEYVTNTSDKRYGLPEIYKLTLTKETGTSSTEIRVHYSRILHIVDDILESEVFAIPRLQAVYNRLMDLEKLVGGSAEMFWRGARPGYSGKVDKDFEMGVETKKDLLDQVDEYENNLRRILVNEGVELKGLDQQIADPNNHVDIQLTMISAVTGIPKRILSGSERGELSSAQDKSEWLSYVKTRRDEFAEGRIVRLFVDTLITYKILPEVKEYTVQWEDLFALSEKEKAEIGKIRATALKDYATNPMAESTIPPNAFLKYFLGLTDEVIEMIEEIRKTEKTDEGIISKAEQAIIDKEKLDKE